MAGDLSGKWVNVYGSGNLAPVARRWKGQINEVAKAGAGFEQLPEADHNALAGLVNPGPLRAEVMTLFLGAPSATRQPPAPGAYPQGRLPAGNEKL
jgi:glucose/mannose-6-phosphate isomerase